ncbi:glycosyltransferase family 2 protein [Paramicrobacterium agarici]|uniref:glycosyltransferase family 2 protein n=1 Tax=Paramicrobacterium agarici TaxID=630514 RepID=UPI0011505D98|nr:glycosyltransferase [Microbacterium agarici]TQO21535.1 GT2 family glycosyltransferase [Microbacterium agarici]
MSAAEAARPSVGVVVLTQGARPDELSAGIHSVRAQAGVDTDIVVVGNGWQPVGLPEGVRGLGLSENIGIPAGRNRGASQVMGEYIFFLDDDATLPSETFLADAIGLMRTDPGIGLVQPRLEDAVDGRAPRRWIPRIRKGERTRSSNIFSCLEAVIVMPRAVFDACGGWGDEYFYAHEGIELAWRVWDQGKRAWYAGDLVANHPFVHPTRHSDYYRLNARNRVWLARRNLPYVLQPVYVAAWTGITLLRWWRTPDVLSTWFAGWREGWVENPGARSRMSWRTVLRMTAAGRPPIV